MGILGNILHNLTIRKCKTCGREENRSANIYIDNHGYCDYCRGAGIEREKEVRRSDEKDERDLWKSARTDPFKSRAKFRW
jgi:hypothetical protein